MCTNSLSCSTSMTNFKFQTIAGWNKSHGVKVYRKSHSKCVVSYSLFLLPCVSFLFCIVDYFFNHIYNCNQINSLFVISSIWALALLANTKYKHQPTRDLVQSLAFLAFTFNCSHDTVTECQSMFNFRLPSVIIPDRCETFRVKYESCNNSLYKLALSPL